MNASPMPPNISRRPSAREALGIVVTQQSPVNFADSPRLAELLFRHALGLIPPKAHARLTELFRTNPPDVLTLLERACDHLGITGDRADELAARAIAAKYPAPTNGER